MKPTSEITDPTLQDIKDRDEKIVELEKQIEMSKNLEQRLAPLRRLPEMLGMMPGMMGGPMPVPGFHGSGLDSRVADLEHHLSGLSASMDKITETLEDVLKRDR